jgi:hypothetical protein
MGSGARAAVILGCAALAACASIGDPKGAPAADAGAPDAAPCEGGDDRALADGTCYLYVGDAATQAAAAAGCAALDAALASPRDAADTDALVALLADKLDDAWLGGTDADDEGTWRWPDGDEATYVNWDDGEPNNSGGGGEQCMAIYAEGADAGRWHDHGCGATRAYLCQR